MNRFYLVGEFEWAENFENGIRFSTFIRSSIGLTVLLMGLLCTSYSRELVYDPFGRVISLGLFAFWLTSLIFQFLVYSPKVWRGKKFG